MKLEPDKVYKVIKRNTDRSVLTGDLIYIEGKTGALVIPKGKGWLNKNELTPEKCIDRWSWVWYYSSGNRAWG